MRREEDVGCIYGLFPCAVERRVNADVVEGDSSYAPANALTLWYLQPAESHNVSNAWMDYYLPLGNGQIGAMVAAVGERFSVTILRNSQLDIDDEDATSHPSATPVIYDLAGRRLSAPPRRGVFIVNGRKVVGRKH